METLSIKISAAEKDRLRRVAELRAVSMSQLLREGLHKVLDWEEGQEGDANKREVMRILEKHWASAPDGPEDLSTNPKYMEDFGRS
jgi:hypothetical protein